ncbi:HrcA family transcriptional regulator [Carboxydothermus islandicus]|uniref:Heat-inducible transcription repressor HrcA n=1 Tax=Carboxydothermus islandicus TaxID=661089 RepID=A0A1L8D2T0_9THEO|nr:heat-inducible transcriptional repressor HrcA [Carboxydothermus islandicus]GAV25469.1 HrcA family transcriptional regulator [Carboxydothermus islandicus]
MIDERKRKILMAIVQDYISTAEPVGSRTIAKKYDLGISPATIRNEMADLEEMGYLEQPHTSAGRIPSVLGYRYYVDYLMEKPTLSREEEEFIRKVYEDKINSIGDLLEKTGKVLSSLTRYTAVVLSPEAGKVPLKHLQLVLLQPGKVLLIIVLEDGTLHHRVFEVTEDITTQDLEKVSAILNAKLLGVNPEKIRTSLLREIYYELARHQNLINITLELIRNLNKDNQEHKIILGGLINLFNQPEFKNVEKVKTLLSILEQEEKIREIFSQLNVGVNVKIGSELNLKEIEDCSMIAAGYFSYGNSVGFIGVLGPTRMEYAKTVATVEFLSKYLSEIIGNKNF